MSIHETWEADLNDYLCDPDAMKVYADLRRRMISREFEPVADVITQRWRGKYDLYDAYAFGQIYAGIRAGEITLSPIFIGAEPSGDDQRRQNETKLARLPSWFKVVLRKGRGDDDGNLAWTEPILVGESELAPHGIPLEVGYTRPLTALWHLHHERGLARWPYGHDQVWLLLKKGSCAVRR